jgi:uncharacterized protein YgiM (DUF1202 family)
MVVFSQSAVPVAHAQQGGFGGPSGTVVGASALNARTAPSTAAGVLAVLPRGAVYPVTGRLGDNSWYQINLFPSSMSAWVSGQFMSVIGLENVPVLMTTGPTPYTGSNAVVTTAYLNVRSIPDPYTGQIRIVTAYGRVYPVVGKNSGSPTWYEIVLTDGSRGWINGNYANVTNAGSVPITYTGGGSQPGGTASGYVTAYFLNVRSEPNPYVYNILSVIARNQTYTVVGKNASGTWWQIVLPNGVRGWVRGTYFSVSGGGNVPVTYNN